MYPIFPAASDDDSEDGDLGRTLDAAWIWMEGQDAEPTHTINMHLFNKTHWILLNF